MYKDQRKSASIKNNKFFKKIIANLLLIIVSGLVLYSYLESTPESTNTNTEYHHVDERSLQNAYDNKQSNVQIGGQGKVVKVLPDDRKGSQHQKFILKVPTGQKLLIAHNIDLAAKIKTLRKGDSVEFYGEYEWNSKGGIIHWTHHDPRGRHEDGWLKHNGVTYQ